ncbi:hypothetical protein GCM10010964_44670 [Caldovatus sediminis]|uniref:AlpA family phage regulatory protein n=1 Tax=Caldovatus sediminis TaxID=2041189 RepID=A0A8J2ZFZ8_9PROT|nr:hypothetical protein GCM10010964_44670 [Caldovatus sediminis]
MEAAGEFPRRVTLGPRAVGWLESEINQWIAKRAAERDDVEAVAATKLKRTPRKAPTEGVLLPEFRGEHPVP